VGPKTREKERGRGAALNGCGTKELERREWIQTLRKVPEKDFTSQERGNGGGSPREERKSELPSEKKKKAVAFLGPKLSFSYPIRQNVREEHLQKNAQ